MPTPLRFQFPLIFRFVIFVLSATACALPVARAAESDGELKLVIVLTRHGVRSPLQTNDVLGKYAAEPWPQWPVKPGILTPHGRQQMVNMGAYYLARYKAEGLLSGDATKDAAEVFFRSDNDQRTLESALGIAEGLLPGTGEPNLHARLAGVVDPLFQPVKAGSSSPDRDLAIAAVSGRFGNDPANILQAYRPEFAALEQVLFGPAAKAPPGKISLIGLPAKVVPGTRDHTVSMEGPLRIAEQIADALLLEYTEGLPMKDVGWGRLDAATLTQLLKLHSLYFDLNDATLYPAQAQASNLADHLLQTMQMAAGGPYVPEVFGKPGQKLIIVVGHDTNIVNLGGLLGANWYLPGTALNPVLPAGAFVIELRRRPPDGRYFVRVLYVGQTIEQLRNLTALSVEHPPAIAPIFIPGCSESTPGFDIPFAKFEMLLQRVTDSQFVLTGPP